jgi:hypothetical protein
LVADSHGILARCRNHFSLVLNIHGVNYVKRTEFYTAETVVAELSAFEVELANEN